MTSAYGCPVQPNERRGSLARYRAGSQRNRRAREPPRDIELIVAQGGAKHRKRELLHVMPQRG